MNELLSKTKLMVLASVVLVGGMSSLVAYFLMRQQPPVPAQTSQVKIPEPVDQSKSSDQPADDAVTVAGTVVDENGTPIGGIQVRLILPFKDGKTTTTNRDGTFRLPWPQSRNISNSRSELLASDADGQRQGIAGIINAKTLRDAQNLRIVLKPVRTATFRVLDADKKPVGGAQVAVQSSHLTLLTTDITRDDGTITLRYPAEAEIGCAFAFKSGLGFDYFSTLVAKQGKERKPLPDGVTLQLTGARTVRVKAVDSANRPVAGMTIYPWYIEQSGKPEDINLSGCDAVTIDTDSSGMAVFDWLPTDFGRGISFLSHSPMYSSVKQIFIKQEAPKAELTMRLLRKAKLSGKVVGHDGRPVAGIRVEASGRPGSDRALTRPDGSYEMSVAGEQAYVVTIADERWAAPSHVGIIVREGKPVGGLDFQLGEGTIVRGTVTVGTDQRPVANQYLTLQMRGRLPSEIQKESNSDWHDASYSRWAWTDAEGRYRFCVGPGTYLLSGPSSIERKELAVGREREILYDLHMPRPELGRLTVKVVDADGKPVEGAVVQSQYMRSTNHAFREATTSADGAFEMERALVPAVLHARTKDGKSAGIARIDFEQDQVTIRVASTAEAQGRLLDPDGKIAAGARVEYGVRVSVGEPPLVGWAFCFGGVAISDADGRYTLNGLVVGEKYESNFQQDRTYLQVSTVTPAKAETIQLGDTKIPKMHRPPTLEETTTMFFAKSGKLSERIAKAQIEAESHYLRVLVIVGDPKHQKTRKLIDLTHKDRTIDEFEELAVSVEDVDALAVLRQSYGLGADPLKLPALIVLGEDGKVVAANSPLEGKPAEAAAALTEFLAKQALPRLDAVKLLSAAQDQARRESKRVFLKESGTYCLPCRLLSRYLDEHKAILCPHYVFVEIDSGRFAHGEEVMSRYRKKGGAGIPWCAILDSEGKMLANWDGPDGNIGFPSEPKAIDHFLGILTVTARLTPAQLSELRQALERK